MTSCPRCAKDRVDNELDRRHAWRDGKQSVLLVCTICGYEAVEPRPTRDVRVSEGQRRLTI